MNKVESILGCVVIGAMVFFVGCGKDGCSCLDIGVVLPLTGENSTFGKPIKEGMELAIEELSAEPIKFEIQDSQNKQVKAINILQDFINVKKMRIVVGDVSSTSTMAMVPIAEKSNVFLFSPCAQTPLLTDISPLFARCYPSTSAESLDTAEFVYANFKGKTLAVLFVNDDYGGQLAGDFKKELERRGGAVAVFEPFDPLQSDFKGIISKIFAAKPEVLYLAGNPKSMGTFMRQYASSGYRCQIISDLAFLEHDCLDLAGDSAEGTIVPLTYYNPEDQKYPGACQFGRLYKSRYGRLPSIANAIGYDTVKILWTAIKSVGGNDARKVAEYVRDLKNYDGASGLLNFTHGDVRVPIIFKIVRGGIPVDLEQPLK